MDTNPHSGIALRDFTGQPCKSRLAFEFIPKRKHALALEPIATTLRNNGVNVEVEAPFLLMLHMDGHGVSLFKSGKIIVKDTTEKETARKIAEELVALI